MSRLHMEKKHAEKKSLRNVFSFRKRLVISVSPRLASKDLYDLRSGPPPGGNKDVVASF